MKKRLLFVMLLTVCAVIVSIVYAQIFPEGMISYWKLDEGIDYVANDSVRDNHGILVNDPTWTTGIVDGALSFDGIDDYVEGLHPLFQVGTVETWVNLNSLPTTYRYGIVAATTAGQGICEFTDILEVDPVGTPSFYLWDGYNGVKRPTGPTGLRLNVGEWYHLAATITPTGSGYDVMLYVNGVPGIAVWSSQARYSSFYPYFEFSHVNSCWGYHYSHESFDGVIDEVALYDRALTLEEIQQHYLNGLEGKGYTAIDTLIVQIMELELPKGTETSLTSKLENALEALEKGNDKAAINKLGAFINAVEAQRGKKLTDAQADALIFAADNLIVVIDDK